MRIRTLTISLVGCAADSGSDRLDAGHDHAFEAGYCGNANGDPCICGRPEASAQAAEACAKKTACVGGGRDWTFASDGAVICIPPIPAEVTPPNDAGVDAALSPDASAKIVP